MEKDISLEKSKDEVYNRIVGLENYIFVQCLQNKPITWPTKTITLNKDDFNADEIKDLTQLEYDFTAFDNDKANQVSDKEARSRPIRTLTDS